MSDPIFSVATRFKAGRIYLFGSVLTDQPTISDVDVLVVYDSEDAIAEVKAHLSTLELFVPLDVLFMSSSEERHLNFVEEQGAKLAEEIFGITRLLFTKYQSRFRKEGIRGVAFFQDYFPRQACAKLRLHGCLGD